ncbi:MAG: SufD family Fe-S cluster assembly protein [Candidatus Micrarchaeaceae archaeon]
MVFNENGNALRSDNDQLYKKYRLSIEKEMRRILAGEYHIHSGALEDFAEEVEKKLMLNFDAFISTGSHVLSNASVKISKKSRSSSATQQFHSGALSSADLEYIKLAESTSPEHVGVEIGDGESKSIQLAFANFHAPLISKIDVAVHSGASLKLLEFFISNSNNKPSAAISMGKVVAEAGSTVEINVLCNEDASTHAMHFTELSLAQGARVKLNTAYIGSASCIARNHASIVGSSAYFELNSILLASGSQKFDIFNSSLNSGKESAYLGDMRAVVSGESTSFLKDMSSISPNANGVKAYIKERAIIVGERARISMLPDMSINENNVKATHSAASAPIDEESLFYLMSKGMPRELAESTVLEGFLSDSVSRIDDAAAKSLIMAHLNEKIKTGRFGVPIARSLGGAWLTQHNSSMPEMFEGGAKSYNSLQHEDGGEAFLKT